MLGISLLILGGWAISFAIYDSYQDDDSEDTVINGTEQDDDLSGGVGDDDIFGFLGDDHLSGNAGNDQLEGGVGDDTLIGGDGNDQLNGGEGGDIALGEAGDDTLRGASGDDILLGGDGNDTLHGDRGEDYLAGDAGDDTLIGGPQDDVLVGGTGEDDLSGGDSDDMLFNGDQISRQLTEDELETIRAAIQAGETPVFPADISFGVTDDGEADLLDGGDGDDMLFVGDGDIAIGGAGADEFYLLDGENADLAQVMDLDIVQDALIYVYDEGATEPVLDLEENDDGTQTLSADGVAVAILSSAALTVDDITLFERGSVAGTVI